MLISDFDYELPDELIAQYPATDRRGSRLLLLADELEDRQFADLPSLLRPGDLLVFNDTRVIKARLAATKDTGGRAEVLIERVEGERNALAQVRASKTPRAGGRLNFAGGVDAEVMGRDDEFFKLRFSADVLPLLEKHGEVPLPPYLKRTADENDSERYQTVYARDPGAVAAPTAGLHFDAAMLEETLAAGASHACRYVPVAARRADRGKPPAQRTRHRRPGLLRCRARHARSRRPCHRGRYDVSARAGVGIVFRQAHALYWRDRSLYPAGIPVPLHRRDDY